MAQIAGYWIDGKGGIIPLVGIDHVRYAELTGISLSGLFRQGFTRVAIFDDIMMIESSDTLLPRKAINSILSDFTVYVIRAFIGGVLHEITRTKPIRSLPKI